MNNMSKLKDIYRIINQQTGEKIYLQYNSKNRRKPWRIMSAQVEKHFNSLSELVNYCRGQQWIK